MDIYETLTLLVAGLALGLSIYNTWTHHRRNSPKLKIVVRTGSESDQAYEPVLLRLDIANVGDAEVTLVKRGFRLPDKRWIDPTAIGGHGVESTPRFPRELRPAESHWVGQNPGRIGAHLQSLGFSGNVKIRGEAEDYKGKAYRGEPFEFDVDEWTKLPPLGSQ